MKRNANREISVKSKGEITMKKTIMILVLVTAFVLSFGAVAGAKYAGFTPIRSAQEIEAGTLQGFITFPEAKKEMTRNTVDKSLQSSAHGGYVSTTTKCAVCHSAHRATGVLATATEGTTSSTIKVANQKFLTDGGSACVGCHTGEGAQASTLLVEWGGTAGGPHTAPGRGCTLCHNAGVHGLSTSKFNVMNAYMLGSTRGKGDAGTGTLNAGKTRDQLIEDEIKAGKVLRGGTLDVPVGFIDGKSPIVATPTANSTWWATGSRVLAEAGAPAPDTNANTFAAARSLATAYTCGEEGCHTQSVMFNLNWGMGFDRVDYITGEVTPVTGHILPSVRATGGPTGNACGPCHAGNVAGFPTASSGAGAGDPSRRAYGCDQCHDMVGVATNTTAFPHGNRNIKVYEWVDGEQRETTATSGNLWMYGGSVAKKAGVSANSRAYRGPKSDDGGFADTNWTVLTGVTSGGPGKDDPAGSGGKLPGTGTGLRDGACLKCHVAMDAASMKAAGSQAAAYSNHSAPSQTSINNNNVTGSGRLFLYR